jgi:isocitrate/isopropylmalate dehydrogenase
MMLEHIGELAAARKIERAVREVIRAGDIVTPDLRGASIYGTEQMADAIVGKIAEMA